jgi:hypothetical protein
MCEALHQHFWLFSSFPLPMYESLVATAMAFSIGTYRYPRILLLWRVAATEMLIESWLGLKCVRESPQNGNYGF